VQARTGLDLLVPHPHDCTRLCWLRDVCTIHLRYTSYNVRNDRATFTHPRLHLKVAVLPTWAICGWFKCTHCLSDEGRVTAETVLLRPLHASMHSVYCWAIYAVPRGIKSKSASHACLPQQGCQLRRALLHVAPEPSQLSHDSTHLCHVCHVGHPPVAVRAVAHCRDGRHPAAAQVVHGLEAQCCQVQELRW